MLARAVAALREAIRLKPDAPRPTSTSASSCSRRAKYDEAIAACREAIRLKPDDAEAHSNLGLALASRATCAVRSRRTARRSA